MSDAREAFEIFYTVLGCKIEEQVWNSFVWRSFRTAWDIQQKRIDELEAEVKMLTAEVNEGEYDMPY